MNKGFVTGFKEKFFALILNSCTVTDFAFDVRITFVGENVIVEPISFGGFEFNCCFSEISRTPSVTVSPETEKSVSFSDGRKLIG